MFRSDVNDVTSLRPLCEERIVLFRATSKMAAQTVALEYGTNEAHSYQNGRGELVQWRLVGIDKLEELMPPDERDGWEVASRYVRRSQHILRALNRPLSGSLRQSDSV